MECKICGQNSKEIFTHQILNQFDVKYFQCPHCNFVQTENPFWLEIAYQDSMNFGDTGQLIRNENAAKVITALVYFFFNKKGKFLDYAAGYGILVRKMRDIGLDFYWFDKFTPNLIGKGFERDNKPCRFEMITSFECFEHLENPVQEIEILLKETDSILFTTNLVSAPAPKPEDWWYYGFSHGQHISLYNKKTIAYLAKKFNLNFYSKNGFHLLTKRKINSIYFKLVILLSLKNLFFWIKSNYKSKTDSDLNNLVAKKWEL